jgi:hypothetical protein
MWPDWGAGAGHWLFDAVGRPLSARAAARGRGGIRRHARDGPTGGGGEGGEEEPESGWGCLCEKTGRVVGSVGSTGPAELMWGEGGGGGGERGADCVRRQNDAGG